VVSARITAVADRKLRNKKREIAADLATLLGHIAVSILLN
jgi:hypothetical protein